MRGGRESAEKGELQFYTRVGFRIILVRRRSERSSRGGDRAGRARLAQPAAMSRGIMAMVLECSNADGLTYDLDKMKKRVLELNDTQLSLYRKANAGLAALLLLIMALV